MKWVYVLCEPQLGKRGLYPNVSFYTGDRPVKLRMNILAYCDGKYSIFDISEKLNINLDTILEEITLLKKEAIIQ